MRLPSTTVCKIRIIFNPLCVAGTTHRFLLTIRHLLTPPPPRRPSESSLPFYSFAIHFTLIRHIIICTAGTIWPQATTQLRHHSITRPLTHLLQRITSPNRRLTIRQSLLTILLQAITPPRPPNSTSMANLLIVVD